MLSLIDDIKFEDFNSLCTETNVLLISDLHYNTNRGAECDKVNNKLVKKLCDFVSKNKNWKPHILCVCGDIIHQGKIENYKYFKELLAQLRINFPFLKYFTFTTPGNHDVDRQNIVSVFNFLYTLVYNEPKYSGKNSFTNNSVIDNIYTVSTLSKTKFNQMKLFDALQKFESQYFKTFIEKKLEIEHSPNCKLTGNSKGKKFTLETVYLTEALGIDLVSVNSSFFANFSSPMNDRNNLFLIGAIIDKLKCNLRKVQRTRNYSRKFPVVTLMHHPYYYLHESEHIYATNNSSDLSNNFRKCADFSSLILCGHTHGELLNPSNFAQKTFVINNGSSCVLGDDQTNTFALLKLNRVNGYFLFKSFTFKNNSREKSTANVSSDTPFQFVNRNKMTNLDKTYTSEEEQKIVILKSIKRIANKVDREKFISFQLPAFNKCKVYFTSDVDMKSISLILNILDLMVEAGKKYMALEMPKDEKNITSFLQLADNIKLLISSKRKYDKLSRTLLYY